MIFIPRVRQSKECTSVRKSAFVSNHLSIKLIHPVTERNTQRGGREDEDERERQRDWENVCLQSSHPSPVANRDLGLHNAM